MRLNAARHALVAFTLSSIFLSASPEADATIGCVCIRYMVADMGYTQIYYAFQYDDCSMEAPCPGGNPVWYSGYNLPTDQQCPDCLQGANRAAQQQEPKLAAPKPVDFDLRQGDKEIALNPLLPLTHDPIGFGQPRTGTIIHPDDGEPMTVKVFAMQVNDGLTPVILLGVEVGQVDKPDFANLPAERVDGMTYVYRFKIDDVWQDCVIVASR
jgi:hypothetical protein